MGALAVHLDDMPVDLVFGDRVLADSETVASVGLFHGAVVHLICCLPALKALTASADSSARLWDAEGSGRCETRFQHDNQVNEALFSRPDATLVLTASDDCSARIWQVQSGACLAIFAHQSRVSSARFSPDCSQALTASDDCT